MSNKKMVPEIRFDGFNDEWELTELKDIANYRNGAAHEKSIDSNGEYVVVNSKFISTEGEVKKYSNDQLEPLYKNEIAIVLSDLPNGRALAKTFLVEKNKKYTLNQRIGGITPSQNVHPYFLKEILNRNDYFLKHDDGVNQTNLSIDTIKEFNDYFSSKKEQKEVANFLNELNKNIILRNRELKKLSDFKQAMLQKLFPKEGEKVPEIRFEGFEGEWKKEQIKNLITKGGSGGTPSSTNSSYYNGNIPFLSISDISNSNGIIKKTEKNLTRKGLENSTAYIVPEGSVSLAMYASVGKVAILGIDSATSQAFYNMEFTNIDMAEYVYVYLNKVEMENGWDKLISTGTQANLNADKVKNYSLMIPEQNEMKKVKEYFMHLDQNIQSKQAELKKLKQFKQAMLDKMFV